MTTSRYAEAVRIPPKGIEDSVFVDRIERVKPLLKSIIRNIKHQAGFIDEEDLLQEACLHLYRNRHTYDGTRSSLSTWCVILARRKLWNLTASLLSGIKYPRDENDQLGTFVHIDEVSVSEHTRCSNDGEFNIRYEQLVAQVEKMLNETAQRVFRVYIDQPPELMSMVAADNAKHKKIRGKFVAEYLGISYSSVLKARYEIKQAMMSINDD